MKGYKALVPLALVVCLLLSYYMLFSTRAETGNQYKAYVEAARGYAEQGVVVDALESYAQAVAIDDNIDLNVEIGKLYITANDIDSAIEWGEQMVEKFPNDPKAYEFLLTQYRDCNDFNRCFILNKKIEKKEMATEEITRIMNEIKYTFYYGEAFDDVGVFSQGYIPVKTEGKWGLATLTGEVTASRKFTSVGPFENDLSPVQAEDGEFYFIDSTGNKKLILKIEGTIAGLKSHTGSCYSVYNGKTWAFYNDKYEKISGDYTNCSLLANGVAAVEVDGQWTLVNSNFEKISEEKYLAVAQDDKGVVFRNDTIFVNQGKGYYMIDATGAKKNEQLFKDAQAFLDATYAAVETDKGWTFVNAAGEFVFGDLYFENARSFCNGFAAVQKGGQWGYIDINGNIAIDCQFSGAKDFNSNGCAFVKSDDVWVMLKLYSSNYVE